MRNASLLVLALVVAACAREIDPEEALTRRTVGLAYLEENRLDEAREEFSRLIELVPDEPLGHANLAVTYLRLADYQQAQAAIDRAIELSDPDPDLLLIRATIFEHAGRIEEQGAALEQLVTDHPDHAKGLYALNEFLRVENPEQQQQRAELLGRIVQLLEANLPSRLQLIDVLLEQGALDSARYHAEAVAAQLPELPTEADAPFRQAGLAMADGRLADATRFMRIAHNAMRVTQLYSAGILDLVGPGGPSVGFPVLTFSQDVVIRNDDVDEVFAAMTFSDGTALSTLDQFGTTAVTRPAVGDIDKDGDQDLVIGGAGGARILENDFGAFSLMQEFAGAVTALAVADVDNNGWFDVVVGLDDEVQVHLNTDGEFGDRLTIPHPAAGSINVLDLDQDGDLDLFASGPTGVRVWRNNLDGTFAERTDAAGFSDADFTTMAIGDLDDDGDVDIVAASPQGVMVYDNRREGRFVGELVWEGGVQDVVVADYTNDGWLDVIAVAGRTVRQLRNRQDGSLEPEEDANVTAVADDLSITAAGMADVDNDGRLDLVLTGARADGPGMTVLRNSGRNFESRAPVADVGALGAFRFLDFNEDGDVDVVAASESGPRLLRNDGGNGNRYLNVALVGLRAGNGKNNHFGIGAKVEVRAGDLYQVRVVTSDMTHFGLGQRLKADALRIQWTNGVPQNLFYPGSDQDVVEEQTLKGSCAFLYTFNGNEYTFVTDVVWRSALGMPLGIMGGESTYGPAFPSQEYVRIPRDALAPVEGEYRISVTEELWEAAYLDELQLLVISHPESVDIFVDERFRPPAPGTVFEPYVAVHRFAVARASDERGNDVTERVSTADFRYVDNLIPGPYQGLMAPHDLILDLGADARGRNDIVLYLNGWLFPSDASINVAVSQSGAHASQAPVLQVQDDDGSWVTVDPALSFPSGKNKTTVADLSGAFPGQRRVVRIRTNMQIYWDYIFYTRGGSDVSVTVDRLPVSRADLQYRGFSRMYRKGGRYGPHWFDYTDVQATSPWGQDMTGLYTRFGDVTPLLADADDQSVVMAPGDEVLVAFAADQAPLPDGWVRSFVLYSDGWIKDADMNTATGDAVGPLPYRSAQTYPHGAREFDRDPTRRAYNRSYNTRRVGTP